MEKKRSNLYSNIVFIILFWYLIDINYYDTQTIYEFKNNIYIDYL
jgi:hypothetical protein